MNKSLALLAILSFSVACSKVEKVEKNMDSMKNQTEQMSQTTEEMEETTNVMYQQIRSKEARDTRNKEWAIIKSKKYGFGEKITAATVFYKSFEFQLWSDRVSVENMRDRDALLVEAANELTQQLGDLYKKINVKKMGPARTVFQNDERAFYALALSMHQNHHFQEKSGQKTISFYDIVKSALDKEDSGETGTEYEEILVNDINKEIMVELLKARVDMLAALALKNLTDERDMTLGQKLKAAIFEITGGKLGKIDLPETFTRANEATKKYTIKYLDGAVKARDFLLYIGERKELEKTLKSAFEEIKLGDKEQRGRNNEPVIDDSLDEDSDKLKIKSLISSLIK